MQLIPSSEVCAWKYDICLFVARSSGICVTFGNKPSFILETDSVFGFTFRANMVMPYRFVRGSLPERQALRNNLILQVTC